jgi:peptidoglycan hydrolase CwlO-like protein
MTAKKLFVHFVLICVLVIFFLSQSQFIFSDELDDINKQLQELNKALDQSVSATKPLESQLNALQQQVTGIRQHINVIDQDLQKKKVDIDKGYENLTEKQAIIAKAIRSYYIKSYYDTPLLVFLSTHTASNVSDILAYQRAKTNQDKAIITNLALSITDLETKSEKLKSEQERLLGVKNTLDIQSAKIDEIVKGAKQYQKTLSEKIAALSTKQQEIVNARSGSFTATIGDSDLADDYNASIKGFRESAPSGSFAAFAFGAHTHRKGMSQYGAFGRANNGQDFKAILRAYYGKEPVGKDTGGSLKVAGFGDMDFEGRYLLGIAEMPSSWPKEALKAQAVAARTYAYRYKQEGKEICTNEACQVFNSGKADNPPAAWRQAVEDTRGQVLEDVVTYYSSTTGGFLSTSGWDTTDGQGGSSFSDKAYEKIAGSPWFYKAWYTQGYSTSSNKCGRSNPWLSSSEMADLINAATVLFNGGNGEETGRITPVTTSCWGGNPYNSDELKNIADRYGGGVSSVSNVNVLQGNGSTNEVVFQTDRGEKRFSGTNFKTAFNVRAPGYLSIPQSGFAFYNIEKK